MRRVLSTRAGLARFALATAIMALCARTGYSQTTVTINQADTDVWAATVRGGTYASTNLGGTLETRSSTDPQYLRRALLKFDTQNRIPAGASVSSAILTVTVKQGSADASRRIGIYQVTTSWDQPAVTWKVRKTSTYWGTAGGDLGTKLTEQTVGNAAGTRVSFDVTALVKQAVSGALGSSRYTRLALVDLDGSTSDSWRQYYPPSDATTSYRPTLKVTYGGSTATSSSTSTSTTGKVLRVLHWNIQKNGWGTDGVYDPNRIANWVVKMNPDVVSFNEIESFNSYSQYLDGVALYKSLLESKTGVTWHTWEAQDYGVWGDKGLRSVVFSKYPFSADYRAVYSAGKLKAIGGATITVNGRTINFMTTHFDPYYASYRYTQAQDMVAYGAGFAEDRIICGDFNEQYYNPPITKIVGSYHDAWAVGKSAGIAYSAPDNPDGYTRNSRIDYIFYSRGEQHLTLRKITVVDTRSSSGVMPSDHRPVLAEFLVN